MSVKCTRPLSNLSNRWWTKKVQKRIKTTHANLYSSSHKTAWKLLRRNAQRDIERIHRSSALYLNLLPHTQYFLCEVQYWVAKRDRLPSPSHSNFGSKQYVWLGITHQAKTASRTKLSIYCSWILKCIFSLLKRPDEKSQLRFSQTTEPNPQLAIKSCTKLSQTWPFHDVALDKLSSFIKQRQTSPCRTLRSTFKLDLIPPHCV